MCSSDLPQTVHNHVLCSWSCSGQITRRVAAFLGARDTLIVQIRLRGKMRAHCRVKGIIATLVLITVCDGGIVLHLQRFTSQIRQIEASNLLNLFRPRASGSK